MTPANQYVQPLALREHRPEGQFEREFGPLQGADGKSVQGDKVWLAILQR